MIIFNNWLVNIKCLYGVCNGMLDFLCCGRYILIIVGFIVFRVIYIDFSFLVIVFIGII